MNVVIRPGGNPAMRVSRAQNDRDRSIGEKRDEEDGQR